MKDNIFSHGDSSDKLLNDFAKYIKIKKFSFYSSIVSGISSVAISFPLLYRYVNPDNYYNFDTHIKYLYIDIGIFSVSLASYLINKKNINNIESKIFDN